MGFDFPLIIIVKSGQSNPSLATDHPSSMVRDSVSITGWENPSSTTEDSLQGKG